MNSLKYLRGSVIVTCVLLMTNLSVQGTMQDIANERVTRSADHADGTTMHTFDNSTIMRLRNEPQTPDKAGTAREYNEIVVDQDGKFKKPVYRLPGPNKIIGDSATGKGEGYSTFEAHAGTLVIQAKMSANFIPGWFAGAYVDVHVGGETIHLACSGGDAPPYTRYDEDSLTISKPSAGLWPIYASGYFWYVGNSLSVEYLRIWVDGSQVFDSGHTLYVKESQNPDIPATICNWPAGTLVIHQRWDTGGYTVIKKYQADGKYQDGILPAGDNPIEIGLRDMINEQGKVYKTPAWVFPPAGVYGDDYSFRLLNPYSGQWSAKLTGPTGDQGQPAYLAVGDSFQFKAEGTIYNPCPGPNHLHYHAVRLIGLFHMDVLSPAGGDPADICSLGVISGKNPGKVRISLANPNYPAAQDFGSTPIDVTVVKANLDIYRLEGTKVEEDWDNRSGSITRILNPGEGETIGSGRGKGISLKLEPIVEPAGLSSLTFKLRLKDISAARNKGLVRVYRRNGTTDTKILDNTMEGGTTQATLTEAQLSDEFWMEFDRGGIIEIELAVMNGATEICKDSVRATGIACRPKSGNIYFVNPSGRVARPYADFTDACAADLATVVEIAPAAANIVVAGATYNESGLKVATKILIAGLGAAFDTADPYDFKFDDVPIVDAGAAEGIFLVKEKQDNHFAGLVLKNGKRQNGGAINAKDSSGLSICYTKFSENKADDFGGGVYLKSVTDATINGCVLNNNKADHDAGDEECYDKGMGGAIATLQSTLTVTNCLFQDNLAQVTKGGGVPIGGNAGGGGDIYVQTGAMKLFASRSENAKAGIYVVPAAVPGGDPSAKYFTGDGGSLLVHGTAADTSIDIRDSTFEDSIAYGNGGAVSLSKDSAPEGRKYFVTYLGYPPDEPAALGGGCIGLISNVVFKRSSGGWQGGAISVNGRGMDIDIMDSGFESCQGGATHLRDGKGGAVSVCGGLQKDAAPMNDVLVTRCQINSCSASGNGGGLYVTIRGKLRVDDTMLDSCSALNSGQGLPSSTDDYRIIEGMGGGIHASAGGYVYLQSGGSTSVRILNGNAAVSGGGLSVKSGKAFVQGIVTIQGNTAGGAAVDGYGNGGGVFVTTSYYDDAIGAGFGAALLYNDHGYLSSTVSSLTIAGNTANRWGGGVYAGISPPWYGTPPTHHTDEAKVTLKNATVQNNTASYAANVSGLKPAQIAAERVADGTAFVDFGGTTISGNATTDIGIYTWDSFPPRLTPAPVFGTLGANTIAEPP